MAEPEREQRPLLEVEQSVTSIPEDHEATCWGCGLRLVFTSYSPIYKCGWCGAITQSNQTTRKPDSIWFSHWRRLRDRFFVTVLILFMLFVICGGVWAVYPIVFKISNFCGIFHCMAHQQAYGGAAIPWLGKGILRTILFVHTVINQSPPEHITADLVKCSAFFLSARGLVLVYLAFASLSVNAGIGVLLCQQLSYIYEGNTYLNHLSSPNPLHGERGLQNIVRFFGCPYPISRVLLRYSNTGKMQDNSGSKLL
ncbi:unnamed protein product [Miscanthus lutarioriparius]|uniref:Protein S-acyltransferase n=1 Tax=Miscanthus lutarioriparius TaxID=422564 RepID=A0A811QJ90_9POAL|nr:unnamed protein product [Miscanthus lutarioriparius]